jgi:hypothetical protein
LERAQDFYLARRPMNAARDAAPALRDLPHGIGSLCEIAQAVLIHRDIAPRLYELKLSREKRDLANIRSVARMIEEIERCSAKPVHERRTPAGAHALRVLALLGFRRRDPTRTGRARPCALRFRHIFQPRLF